MTPMARISVQNTFIHVAEEAQPLKLKRSTSLPASQRFGLLDEAACIMKDDCTDVDRSTEASTADMMSSLGSPFLCGSCTPCSLGGDLPLQASGEWPEVFGATCTWTP